MAEQGNEPIVRIPFTIAEDGITFSDSLNLTISEYESLSEQQLQDLQYARFEAYRYFLENPPIPATPTKRDLMDERDELKRQQEELQRKVDRLNERINEITGS